MNKRKVIRNVSYFTIKLLPILEIIIFPKTYQKSRIRNWLFILFNFISTLN